MPYKSKEDQAAAGRRHYERNREAHKARAIAHTKAKREQLRQIIAEVKNVPCQDCGIKYPSYVMDFDHVRGVKVKEVTTLAHLAVQPHVLLEEIAKCEIVCSNCHRERTHRRKATRIREAAIPPGS